MGDQETIVVGQGYEVAIKQPVRGSGQCQAVLDNIGSARRDRPDVRGLRFRLAPAVHHPQSRHRATIVIGVTDLSPEISVTNLSIEKDLFDLPLLLLDRRGN